MLHQWRTNPNAPLFVENHSKVISNNYSYTTSVKYVTCRVMVCRTCVEAKALLDNNSSAYFVSERHFDIEIWNNWSANTVPSFTILSLKTPQKIFEITAIIIPKCDLPFTPVSLKTWWTQTTLIQTGPPGKIDPHPMDWCLCWWLGPTGALAFESHFGWVLAGVTSSFLWHHNLSYYCSHWWWLAEEVGNYQMKRNQLCHTLNCIIAEKRKCWAAGRI